MDQELTRRMIDMHYVNDHRRRRKGKTGQDREIEKNTYKVIQLIIKEMRYNHKEERLERLRKWLCS